jgi:hypothetical protein
MKRIIIACDGTGQSASRGGNSIPTNVTHFCDALSNSSSTQQIVFYQSGVGTQDLGLGWGVGRTIQGALGEGVEDNVADGYAFLMNNYQIGDKLFFFGFSRGAFTARVLANIVTRLGIISKIYSRAFGDTVEAFKNGTLADHDNKMKERNPNWVHKVEIEMVGCWDTVASLGIPWNPLANPGGVSGKYKHFDGSLVKGDKNFHSPFFQDLTTLAQASIVLSTPWPWTSIEVHSPRCCGTCHWTTGSQMLVRFVTPSLILTLFSSHRP